MTTYNLKLHRGLLLFLPPHAVMQVWYEYPIRCTDHEAKQHICPEVLASMHPMIAYE